MASLSQYPTQHAKESVAERIPCGDKSSQRIQYVLPYPLVEAKPRIGSLARRTIRYP